MYSLAWGRESERSSAHAGWGANGDVYQDRRQVNATTWRLGFESTPASAITRRRSEATFMCQLGLFVMAFINCIMVNSRRVVERTFGACQRASKPSLGF